MNLFASSSPVRRKTIWGLNHPLALLLVLAFGFSASVFAAPQPGRSQGSVRSQKSDGEVSRRKNGNPNETTSVIVRLAPGATLPSQFKQFARRNGQLNIINGVTLDLPNRMIAQLEKHPDVFWIDDNRSLTADNYRTSVTVGARGAQAGWGLTGSGVGVAVIDSGIATWHNDLTNSSAQVYPFGDQRVAAFVDFVNGQTTPYDDNGHGTHVAGIIAGNGFDSAGDQAGMAPEASLVSLKVLDANGQGTISNSIAALDWVLQNHAAYNIRVVNMSVGAGVYESYWSDPLTVAAKHVVEAGVVVVAAAGNLGENAAGLSQYGGVTAPGNAPWVLTVGASSTNGTKTRIDDLMAGFSSRGPTYLDWSAKPDLVAPGVGTVSLADPASLFYTTKAQYLVAGSVSGGLPYLSLSGTSMAAPAVAGTVALMLQANPGLTPNAVKALLQYTAEVKIGYDPLTQGAGFLNSLGAVRLARFFAAPQAGQAYPTDVMWSHHIIWGNHMISGGVLMPAGSAWAVSTTWGVAKTDLGDNIVWGTMCAAAGCDNIVWGTGYDNIVWGTGDDDNIVWGTDGDDNIVWGTWDDNIVWGTGDDDNIVWGTGDDDNIVWGTDCGGADCDNIVWGTRTADNIVWGTTDGDDNIVWGTNGYIDNIVWGTGDDDNIVWGTTDNIVWGTEGDDNIVWGTTTVDGVTWVIQTYLTWLWNYYYADYAQYLDWFTDTDFYQYTDMLTDWVNSLAPWLAAPADTTTTVQ